jgi:hypothetical protein
MTSRVIYLSETTVYLQRTEMRSVSGDINPEIWQEIILS